MVTKRSSGSRADSFRTSFNSYLTDFGTTVTLRTYSQTKDSMGRVTVSTPTTSTISADIQWVSKSNLDHINAGEVKIGDGMLFVKYSENISIHDSVDFSGERYTIVEQIEGEQVKGDIVYKGYIIRKDAQA